MIRLPEEQLRFARTILTGVHFEESADRHVVFGPIYTYGPGAFQDVACVSVFQGPAIDSYEWVVLVDYRGRPIYESNYPSIPLHYVRKAI